MVDNPEDNVSDQELEKMDKMLMDSTTISKYTEIVRPLCETINKQPLEKTLNSLKDDPSANPFDVLGSARRPVELFHKAFVHFTDICKKAAENSNGFTVMQLASNVTDSNTSFKSLISELYLTLNRAKEGSVISGIFRLMANSVADLWKEIKNLNEGQMKQPLQREIDSKISNILKIIGEKGAGPWDDVYLKEVSQFLSYSYHTGGQSVGKALALFWTETFAKHSGLMIPEEMQKVLKQLQSLKFFPKSHGFVKPSEPMKSSSTRNSPAVRKRLLLLDEDSVDYVEIKTDSAKKQKLTDHQKELFSAAKENLPFFDEDSRQCVPVIKNIGTDFDVESSQSGSLSNKPKRASNDAIPVLPISAEIRQEQQNEQPIDNIVDCGNCDDLTTETVKSPPRRRLRKRSSAVKLVFEEPITPGKDTEVITLSSGDESKDASSESSSAEDAIESNSASDDQNITTPRSSRKSSRPKKIIQKPIPQTKSPGHKKRGRSIKVSVTALPTEAAIQPPSQEDEADMSFDEDDLRPLAVFIAKDKQADVEEMGSTDEDLPKLVEELEEPNINNNNVESNRTPEAPQTPTTSKIISRINETPGILKKVDSPAPSEKKRLRVHFSAYDDVDQFHSTMAVSSPRSSSKTSSKIFRDDMPVLISSEPAEHSPPKMIAKPSPEVAESKNPSPKQQVESTPTDGNVPEKQSNSPIYPEAISAGRDVSISVQILKKLLHIPTDSAQRALRKQLYDRKINTVGQLAALTSTEVETLKTIKAPRTKSVFLAITDFMKSLKKESPEKQNSPVNAVPVDTNESTEFGDRKPAEVLESDVSSKSISSENVDEELNAAPTVESPKAACEAASFPQNPITAVEPLAPNTNEMSILSLIRNTTASCEKAMTMGITGDATEINREARNLMQTLLKLQSALLGE